MLRTYTPLPILLLPSSPDGRTPWYPISGSLADTQGHGCRRACAGSPHGYYAHARSWKLMSSGGCQAGIPTTRCWKGVALVCYQYALLLPVSYGDSIMAHTKVNFRYIAFLLYGITLDGIYFPLCGLLTLLTALVLVLTQPYKRAVSHYIKTNRAFLILYAMFYCAIYGANLAILKDYNIIKFFYIVAFALSLFPLLCILVLMLHSVFSRWRFFLDLGHSIRSLCRGYTAMDEIPEDENCDRIVNPQAYLSTPGRHMENCSSLSTR